MIRYNIYKLILQVIVSIIFSLIITFSYKSNAEDKIAINSKDGKLILNIKLEDEDEIYWKFPGKFGMPTQIALTDTTNLKSYKIDWPNPIFKTIDGKVSAILKGELEIPIYLEPTDPSDKIDFSLKVSYAICNKMGCFLKDYNFRSSISHPAALPNKTTAPINDVYRSGGELFFKLDFLEKNSGFVLVDENNVIYLGQKLEDEIKFDLKNSNSKYFQLISLSGDILSEINLDSIKTKNADYNLWKYIIFAAIGGFILNFMPCVLPVLSLKLFALINSKTNYERRWECAVSLLAIFSYFISLGVITIILKGVGIFFMPGFSMQIPFVILFCLAVVTISLSIVLDRIQLNIDASSLDRFSGKTKFAKSFITTIASTILATPCTAPFLATSMSFAISQSNSIILLMYAASATGFALPFIISFIYPNLLKFLPKPGPWQQNLKYLFSILLIGTIIWLIWILNSQLGNYAAISALFIVYILKVALEFDQISWRQKIISIIIISSLMIYVPQNIGQNFKNYENYIETIWQKYDETKVNDAINQGKSVFIYVTADWCMTCQLNKIMVLNKSKTISLFKKEKILLFDADITLEDENITRFLRKYDVQGIPFAIIYGKNNKEGKVLPVVFSYDDLENAIKETK